GDAVGGEGVAEPARRDAVVQHREVGGVEHRVSSSGDDRGQDQARVTMRRSEHQRGDGEESESDEKGSLRSVAVDDDSGQRLPAEPGPARMPIAAAVAICKRAGRNMPDWLHAPDYTLARVILQRGLGLVYLIAFLVALEQFRALLGERGLLPVPRFLARATFREAPSLFHFRYSDRLLTAVSLAGIVLSLAVVIGLPDRWPAPLTIAVWLVLWALY